MRLASWLILSSPLIAFLGCTVREIPCNPDVAKGDDLDVEIVERWTESSAFTFDSDFTDLDIPASCGERSDIKADQKFVIQLGDYSGGASCLDLLCPTDFPTQSEAYEGTSRPNFQELCFRSDRKVGRSESCEAGRSVSLHRVNNQADMFSAPQAGKLPPVVLTLSYRSGKGYPGLKCDRPESAFPPEAELGEGTFECSDTWVVNVRKR